ncbi:gamma-glutamyltransferase [Litoreibacter albidus]|uniref:Gamma-glutamyltranspeptidase / glutathione hydrolase n=1 Tax=Litoreibacter albidus TaxID=670155 RepID=A0A1H3A8M7_9RHOB|nr:gamma-glutamyltransferase [Litoreibacter albidus]SDX26090.1 gamma-glutamyltranspeptidase / glutathione hydrolase [Litoreibacter albidus]
MTPEALQAARVERWTRTKPAARSAHGIVTSQHYAASEAGLAVLSEGGNAVDAAVTTAFTLQTAEPWMSGLGACGYMLVGEPDGQVETIEFTGRLPAVIDANTYAPDPSGALFFNGNAISRDHNNIRGFPAAAIPGCVRGFDQALTRYGTISFARALTPALERAKAGMTVDWHTTLAIALAEQNIRKDPGMSSVFLPNGTIPQPGQILAMPALAATLERLVEHGTDEFYQGQIATDLVADLQAGGNGITKGDLRNYAPLTYPSVTSVFGRYQLHTAGHTSAGARLHATITQFTDRHGDGPVSPEFFTAMGHSIAAGFEDAVKPAVPADFDTKGSTTQINAVDAQGRFVSITFTLFNRFGACALSPRTGIILNNGMAWFDARAGRTTSMLPNAYAHSNMCPAIVTKDDAPVMAVGASGANMIVPAVAQFIALHLCANLDVEEAAHRPRLHLGPEGKMSVDADMMPAEIAALERHWRLTPAQTTVMPRPFGSPSMIGKDANGFVGIPDTSYPAAYAAAYLNGSS